MKEFQLMKEWGMDPEAMKFKEGQDEQNLTSLRTYMKKWFEEMKKHPAYVDKLEKCTHSTFLVKYSNVYAHIPEVLTRSPEKRAAIVYAHGGGCAAGRAEEYQPFTAALAVESECVVFSVEYRLAPETKCPDNVMDFYEALKYIHENCDKWNVDPEKIVISGESGGGYVTMATMVLLAQREESHLVRAAIPIIPMISDYFFGDKESMTLEERQTKENGMEIFWKYIAKDLKAQWSDPLLFPAKASDELIQKMPATVIISCEFDIFITETERMARRMRQNGRLLEFCCLPGITHGAFVRPEIGAYRAFHDAYKLAINEYVKQ